MKLYIPIIIFIFSLTGLVYITAQESETPAEEASNPILQYLALDCANAELDIWLQERVLERADEATSYFISLFEAGIPDEYQKELEADLRVLYSHQQTLLESPNSKFTLENAEGELTEWKPAPLTEEEFISNRMKQFELELQARAMEGLALVKTKSAMAFLQKMAANANYPLQFLAKELVE